MMTRADELVSGDTIEIDGERYTVRQIREIAGFYYAWLEKWDEFATPAEAIWNADDQLNRITEV